MLTFPKLGLPLAPGGNSGFAGFLLPDSSRCEKDAVPKCPGPHLSFLEGVMCASKASRRDFLKITGAGMAGTALASAAPSYSRILGASDRVRVAICGVRGRGHDHIRGFSRVPNAEIAALCDVDENVLNQRLANVEKLGLPKPKSSVDVRKVLEDKDIEHLANVHVGLRLWQPQFLHVRQ